jgi:HSP20 family protein
MYMFMQRMQPVFPFGDLRREVNRLFEDYALPAVSGRAPSFPAINAWEDENNLFVEAELPGLTMNDLEITVVGDELSIKGERKPCGADEQATFHRRERGVGSFSRFITLPMDVDAERVEAVLRDGVLSITLPKAAEAKPRRIQVKGA